METGRQYILYNSVYYNIFGGVFSMVFCILYPGIKKHLARLAQTLKGSLVPFIFLRFGSVPILKYVTMF